MDSYEVLKNQAVTAGVSPVDVTYQVPPPSKTQVGGASGPVPSALAASIHTQSLVTKLFVCNLDVTNAADIDVKVSNFDAITPVVTYLYSGLRLYPKNTLELTLNLTLKASDEATISVTQVGSTTPIVDVTLFGIAMTTGVGPRE